MTKHLFQFLPSLLFSTQRLAKENEAQSRLIKTLMTRVDSLEDSLQMKIEEALKARHLEQHQANNRGGMFGSLFGSKEKKTLLPAEPFKIQISYPE